MLEVPKFISSVHKSTKQCGFNFAYDARKVWIELPGDSLILTFARGECGFTIPILKFHPRNWSVFALFLLVKTLIEETIYYEHDDVIPAGFQLHHAPRSDKKGERLAISKKTDQQDTFEHITVKQSESHSTR